MNSIKRFVSNEEGLETVEYAVMTALVVGALILAIGTLSGAVSGRMNSTASTINAIP
ncbi:MAG: Flp family type IVb pilin [Candidatus Hydrogenedentota bacterium]